jgi:hypothetical protein
MMMWRIAEGHLDWGEREVELLYESTLDSISEAFDVFHYPISQYMLDARADVWEAGLAPQSVKEVVELSFNTSLAEAPNISDGRNFLLGLGGEIAQIRNGLMLALFQNTLTSSRTGGTVWEAPTGAIAYTLGARDVARKQALRIVEGIESSGAQTIVVDGPATAWALTKVYPSFGVNLAEEIRLKSLNAVLKETQATSKRKPGKVFYHDSRAAYLISENKPSHLAIMPGYREDETAFGAGDVYDLPRQLLDKIGVEQVSGTWTRGLAKSCGADDGLWLTHPDLAAGLAQQRLDYARQLGAEMIVTDSPLCARWIEKNSKNGDLPVYWLPELLTL